jgi:hypothetical protein
MRQGLKTQRQKIPRAKKAHNNAAGHPANTRINAFLQVVVKCSVVYDDEQVEFK